MIGTALGITDRVDPAMVSDVLDRALRAAHAGRFIDPGKSVLMFFTPHWADYLDEISHRVARQAYSQRVWGCVSHAVYGEGRLCWEQPAVVAAVIASRHSDANAAQLSLRCSSSDVDFMDTPLPVDVAHGGQHQHMGLLSYGPSEDTYPRIHQGRVSRFDPADIHLSAQSVLMLDSIGLAPMGPWGSVEERSGLTIKTVSGQPALTALCSPQENTRPVGLRLGVERHGQVLWIPVIAMNVDGSITVAAPVAEQERVCLAERTMQCGCDEVAAWQQQLPLIAGQAVDADHNATAANDCQAVIQTHDQPQQQLGILMGGLDRSPLCHFDDTELDLIRRQWPGLAVVGGIGQAVWAETSPLGPVPGQVAPDEAMDKHSRRARSLPLNHRLAMAVLTVGAP